MYIVALDTFSLLQPTLTAFKQSESDVKKINTTKKFEKSRGKELQATAIS